MSYTISSKNRKFKYRLNLIADRLSFNFLNLSKSQKVVFLWIVTTFVSLFLNWFTIKYDKEIKNWSFSINCWYLWYVTIIILGICLFIILSNKNKELIKTKTAVIFHDHTIIIFSSITIILLNFVVFNSIRWFTTFYTNVKLGNWLSFSFIWAILILIGGIFNYREQKQEVLNKVYIENKNLELSSNLDDYKDIISSNKNNMTLPI